MLFDITAIYVFLAPIKLRHCLGIRLCSAHKHCGGTYSGKDEEIFFYDLTARKNGKAKTEHRTRKHCALLTADEVASHSPGVAHRRQGDGKSDNNRESGH